MAILFREMISDLTRVGDSQIFTRDDHRTEEVVRAPEGFIFRGEYYGSPKAAARAVLAWSRGQ